MRGMWRGTGWVPRTFKNIVELYIRELKWAYAYDIY